MADEENNEQAADRPATTRKKATKEGAVRKKRVVRAAPSVAVDDEVEDAKPAAVLANEAEPEPPQAGLEPSQAESEPLQAAGAAIPAATPQPVPAVGAPAMHMERETQEPGISGWLVMWGPLIILLFLILVHTGNERRVTPFAATTTPASPQAESTPVVTLEQPEMSISPERAAEDLAAAFKAAIIPLPQAAVTREPAAPAVPLSLRDNPWAPSIAQQPASGRIPRPPPGYGVARQPPHWGPPRGYGYAPAAGGAPGYGQPRAGYGQAPPGYSYPPPGYYRQGAPGSAAGPGYGGAPAGGGYPPQYPGAMPNSSTHHQGHKVMPGAMLGMPKGAPPPPSN